jgi:hypothetical protein
LESNPLRGPADLFEQDEVPMDKPLRVVGPRPEQLIKVSLFNAGWQLKINH